MWVWQTLQYAGEQGAHLPLQPAVLPDRSGALGCECLIVQLVPGMLVLKNIFSKERNLYTRSLTRLDLVVKLAQGLEKESSPLLPSPKADRQGKARHEEENVGC